MAGPRLASCTTACSRCVHATTVVSTRLSKGSESQMRMVVPINRASFPYDGIAVVAASSFRLLSVVSISPAFSSCAVSMENDDVDAASPEIVPLLSPIEDMDNGLGCILLGTKISLWNNGLFLEIAALLAGSC